MATEILPAQQADGQLFHQPRSPRSSPSASALFLPGSPPPLSSSPRPPSLKTSAEHYESISTASPPPSSLDSSPTTTTSDFSKSTSLNTTPISSGLSFDDRITTDDDITFPNYDGLQCLPEEYESTRKSNEEDTDVPEISTTTDTTQEESPLLTPTPADDTAIKQEPSRHVDYLSHEWREEDIWASWRHIVSQRKVYGQKSRLENASWRTWAKSKYGLRTVSPEKLNWLKESDVTWLYGPLKPAQSHPITSDTSTPPSQLSKNSSFINKKPILKKRSVSEVMLQKSLSSSSLVKQAAASVQAQQARPPARRGLNRTNSDFGYASSTAPSQPPSREEVDYFSSRRSSSAGETPSDGKEKHIRFDEVVEQCVAVDCKEPGIDEESDLADDPSNSALSESSSDEGLLVMKRKTHGPRRDSSSKGRLSRSNSSSGKMIETIPATTLKYRTDSPDVTQEAQHHRFGGETWSSAGPSSSRLSPSPSQETLRPSRPSRNFLLADDDEDDESENSASWSFGASNPNSSLGAASASTVPSSGSIRTGEDFNPTDGYDGMQGMRRTESGMLMPIDDDEDDLVAVGLFGRVSETVNTVKDIGWVLWNSFSARRDS